MNETKIEWTEKSWNPLSGCSPVSEGCRNCYARRMAQRLRGRAGYPADDLFRVTFHPNRLEEPLRMRKPRRIFVCSMGDLFHPDVPDEWIDQVFAVMALCSQHTFQVLTKRPGRMAEYLRGGREGDIDLWGGRWPSAMHIIVGESSPTAFPLRNVWIGTSIEDQRTADVRISHLLRTPAAVRFVSVEPMLGPVDLIRAGLRPAWKAERGTPPMRPLGTNIDWVICGGETGPGARPMHPDWPRSLRDQCQAAGVPFFFKKMGSVYKAETPVDLLIREYPDWTAGGGNSTRRSANERATDQNRAG